MTKRRPLALGAAITIGVGSLFFAAPAFAEDTETPIDQQQVQESPAETSVPAEAPVDAAETLKQAGVQVVALGVDANGQPVVVQTEASEDGPKADAAIRAYAAEVGSDTATVQTVAQAPTAYAATDVVGGAGYLAFEGQTAQSFCSVGFSAYSPSGAPVLLSAGHCTHDGAYSATGLVKPSVQPAVTGDDPGTGGESNGTGILGQFGFSQFGGTGNSTATPNNPDPNGTDVSIIENIGDSFDLRPEVTDWKSAGSDDLAASTIKIKTVKLSDPATGSAVSKSGRTTGYTNGTVGNLVDGWSTITTPEGEPRWVRGFESNVLAAPGDSGGAVFQGNAAIGVISGGSPASETSPQFTWTASLKHIMPHIKGYEVAIDIDKPTAQGGNVAPGSDITVSVPSNANALRIARSDVSGGSDAPASNGKATFSAPTEPGEYSYTLTAVNGFSSSEPTTLDIKVTIAAPTVDAVVSDSTDVTLTGTGLAGAALTATVDGEELTTEVGQDGKWSIPTKLEIGKYEISAVQEADEQVSPAGKGSVTVRPAAPAITSIEPGTVFEADEAPSTISGTGIDGAQVTVKLNGTVVGSQAATLDARNDGANPSLAAVVEDGAWSIDLGSQLGSGAYTVEATQTVNNAASQPAGLTFNVAVAAVDPGTPVGPGNPGDPGSPAAPGGQGGAGGGQLPVTGASDSFSMLPYGLAALGMLILGAGAIVLTQRRLQSYEAE